MEWLLKHADAVGVSLSIITAIIVSMIWMNGKFNEIEKDIAVIKTVLVMRQIMPVELAKTVEEINNARN